MAGYIGLENFCSIVESLAPWTDKTPVEKRATRADYEDALAEVRKPWFIGIGHVTPNPYFGVRRLFLMIGCLFRLNKEVVLPSLIWILMEPFPWDFLTSEPVTMGCFRLILITCSFEKKHLWWVDQKKLFEDKMYTYTCTQKRKKHHLTTENQPFKKFENSPLPFGAVIPCSGVEMVGLGFRFSVFPLCHFFIFSSEFHCPMLLHGRASMERPQKLRMYYQEYTTN